MKSPTPCPHGCQGIYLTNFRVGDPFVKIDQGFARLPGAGYEAIHPELKGLNPEDYPDIYKLSILADVAPYSREYNQGFPSCGLFWNHRKALPPTRDLFKYLSRYE